MTLARKNAALAQTINVNNNAIGDTILVPSGGFVFMSGMVYVNSVPVSISGHNHNVSDVIFLSGILENKLDNDDIIFGGFF